MILATDTILYYPTPGAGVDPDEHLRDEAECLVDKARKRRKLDESKVPT